MNTYILEVTGDTAAPTSPTQTPSQTIVWSQATWAQKFEVIAFFVAFGLIFLVMSVGVAIRSGLILLMIGVTVAVGLLMMLVFPFYTPSRNDLPTRHIPHRRQRPVVLPAAARGDPPDRGRTDRRWVLRTVSRNAGAALHLPGVGARWASRADTMTRALAARDAGSPHAR